MEIWGPLLAVIALAMGTGLLLLPIQLASRQANYYKRVARHWEQQIAQVRNDRALAQQQLAGVERQLFENEQQLAGVQQKVLGIGEPLLEELGRQDPQDLKLLENLIPLGLKRVGTTVYDHWNRVQAIKEMEQTWLDLNQTPAAGRELLLRHLWLLEPDYRMAAEPLANQALGNALDVLFPNRDRTYATKFAQSPAVGLTPDLIGLFDTRDSLLDAGLRRPKVLLVGLVRRPGAELSFADMEQAFALAYNALKLIPPEDCVRVDCLVVGGFVPEHLDKIIFTWKDKVTRTVTVAAISYQDLIERAKRLIALESRALLPPPAPSAAASDDLVLQNPV